MIPYDVDPSLHTAEPERKRLDDGFSPPRPEEPEPDSAAPQAQATPADALGDKSPF